MRRFIAGVLIVGCSSADVVSSGPCGSYDAVALMSDGTSSRIEAFSLDGRVGTPVRGSDLGQDPVLAASHGRTFCVARDNMRVIELDACGQPQRGFNVSEDGVKANPQDVAASRDGRLWVPRFGTPTLLVMTPSGGREKAIDLSSYDGDGNPNAASIQIVDVAGEEKAFVSLGRLDDHDSNFASKQPSEVVRIDVKSGAAEATLELEGRNPFNLMVSAGGALWLSMAGAFDRADEMQAGIERLDPVSFTSHLVVRERDLGGSVTAVAVAGGCGAAIVADSTPTVNATSVVTFDPDTGEVHKPPLFATGGFDLWAITWQKDVLLVGDRRPQANGYPVHAFQRSDRCNLHALPDAIVLTAPPVAIRASSTP